MEEIFVLDFFVIFVINYIGLIVRDLDKMVNFY